jgi:signal peptidase I
MEQETQAEERASGKVKQVIAFVLELNWFLSASAALLLFILLKKFVVDIARVNSHDMNATYSYGDALLISRSFDSLATGDVVQFRYPVKDSLAPAADMIQRLFAMPGDTIEVVDKAVYLNGTRLRDTITVLHNFFVKAKGKLDSTFREKYGLWEGGDISDRGDYSFSLTEAQTNLLRNDTMIISVDPKKEKHGNWDETLFPNSNQFKWNMDHYGPIYIPAQGDTLKLDSLNLPLYETLLTSFEKNTLQRRADSILINGKYTREYVVKKNYFFVLGDNRDNANDSRNWGFLPENFIKGKVVMTLRKSKR